MISFNPEGDVQSIIAGGGDKWLAECRCDKTITNPASYQARTTKSEKGTLSIDCDPAKTVNCQHCKLSITKIKATSSGGSASNLEISDGFIIVKATALHEL